MAGDVRLLVTQSEGQPLALLYRAVVPGTKEPVPFTSPWRRSRSTVSTTSARAAAREHRGEGRQRQGQARFTNSQCRSPRLACSLRTGNDQGDLGILRGNGFQTLQRVYWNNKATAITADVPSEAELTPALWGRWQFKAQP